MTEHIDPTAEHPTLVGMIEVNWEACLRDDYLEVLERELNGLRDDLHLKIRQYRAGVCKCEVTAPDEFGNRDLIEHPDCRIHS